MNAKIKELQELNEELTKKCEANIVKESTTQLKNTLQRMKAEKEAIEERCKMLEETMLKANTKSQHHTSVEDLQRQIAKFKENINNDSDEECTFTTKQYRSPNQYDISPIIIKPSPLKGAYLQCQELGCEDEVMVGSKYSGHLGDKEERALSSSKVPNCQKRYRNYMSSDKKVEGLE